MILPFAVFFRKLALSFWLGMMLFFSFIIAPTVFRVLPKEFAAQLQSAIFPLYYKSGIVCSVIMAFSLFAKNPLQKRDLKWFGTFTGIVLSGVIFAFCLWVLTPKLGDIRSQINSAIDAQVQEVLRNEFSWYHKISVFLNLVVIVALLVLLAIL